jgi:hypothetical protein
VGFLSLFVKLALQTNQKLGLKSLQWVLLFTLYSLNNSIFSLHLFPFSFSLIFSTIAVAALFVFFLPSQLSSLLPENAKNTSEHHCTTRRQKRRRAPLTFFSAGEHRWTA